MPNWRILGVSIFLSSFLLPGKHGPWCDEKSGVWFSPHKKPHIHTSWSIAPRWIGRLQKIWACTSVHWGGWCAAMHECSNRSYIYDMAWSLLSHPGFQVGEHSGCVQSCPLMISIFYKVSQDIFEMFRNTGISHKEIPVFLHDVTHLLVLTWEPPNRPHPRIYFWDFVAMN